MIAQIVLTTGLVLVGLYVMSQNFISVVPRMGFGLVVTFGIFLVWFPETTNVIAHHIGIGRGADLVFYIYIIASMGATWFVYLRVVRLEHKLIELARRIALERAATDGADAGTQERQG